MVHWICGVQLEQHIETQDLHEKLGITGVPEEIQWYRPRYTGHFQKMDANVWPRRVNYIVHGILPRGHPQLRWSDVITKDLLKDLNIRKELSHERIGW